ncbi:MAG TPA: hypothetical protein VGF86_15720 [Candidatus Tumulicola sp.]
MAAKAVNPTHKQQLEQMADARGMLARERAKQLLKNSEANNLENRKAARQ